MINRNLKLKRHFTAEQYLDPTGSQMLKFQYCIYFNIILIRREYDYTLPFLKICQSVRVY